MLKLKNLDPDSQEESKESYTSRYKSLTKSLNSRVKICTALQIAHFTHYVPKTVSPIEPLEAKDNSIVAP